MSRRERIARLVETLLGILDQLDGDADLEAEPVEDQDNGLADLEALSMTEEPRRWIAA